MKSQDVKKEILNGIFRTKDGLSSNELTELLNTLIEVARLEGKPASLDTLIQRVEGLKITKDVKYLASDKDIYNGAIEETVEILRSVPVIRPTAYFQYETYTEIQVANADLPDKFRLKDIQILLP